MGSEFIREYIGFDACEGVVKKAALETETILKFKIFRVLFYIHVEELQSARFFDVRENSKGNYMLLRCS